MCSDNPAAIVPNAEHVRLLREAYTELTHLLEDIGPCEHEANICACGLARLTFDIGVAVGDPEAVAVAAEQAKIDVMFGEWQTGSDREDTAAFQRDDAAEEHARSRAAEAER